MIVDASPPQLRSSLRADGVARPDDRVESARPTVPAGHCQQMNGSHNEQLRRHCRVESRSIASKGPSPSNRVTTLRRSGLIVRGRESQMDAIRRRLRDAENGSGSVILLEGRAGFGKSLLLEETARGATGFRVGSSRAFPGDDGGSMAPLLAALFGSASPLIDRKLIDDERIVPTETVDSIDWLADALAAAARQATARRLHR